MHGSRPGDSAAALPVLVAAISADPLRERLRALLMLALYRAGRHPEALRSYQRFRALLSDELGIDPSPDLRRLHERILLHDPGLLPDGAADDDHGPASARNPYKGLRPFAEPDAPDFFGRTALIERVLDELRLGTRLLTLVGPSGSGKSSLVAAGVLPRLRAGAVPGSGAWRVDPVLPDEVGAAHLEQLVQSPVDGTTVLLIDQLEELFLHPDAAVTGSFLRALTALVTAPAGETRAVVTLRADFYDRPLQHRDLAEAFLAGVVTVLPLSAADLEQAVVRPAARVGAGDRARTGLAELVSEAVDRPGALPLLQYALTELFDRSGGGQMTSSAYHEIGGLRGALLRRAERLYTSLDPGQQEVATEVLLRLVRVVPGERDSRRRIPVSDLSGTDLDPVALSEVLEQLARHRLISLDRDAATAEGTIELAHEALLWEWDRYAGWVERHRAALGERDALLRAVEEWESSGKDADFLLKGRRLEKFATWSAQAGLRMTAREEALLAASLALERSEAAPADRAGARRAAAAAPVPASGDRPRRCCRAPRDGRRGSCPHDRARDRPRRATHRAAVQQRRDRGGREHSRRLRPCGGRLRPHPGGAGPRVRPGHYPRSVVCPPSKSTSSSSAPSRPTSTRSPDDIPGSGTSSSTTSATSPT